jgi:hypothetical protein
VKTKKYSVKARTHSFWAETGLQMITKLSDYFFQVGKPKGYYLVNNTNKTEVLVNSFATGYSGRI